MLSDFKRFMTGEPCSFARFQVVVQDEDVSKCSTVPSLISILRVILALLDDILSVNSDVSFWRKLALSSLDPQ